MNMIVLLKPSHLFTRYDVPGFYFKFPNHQNQIEISDEVNMYYNERYKAYGEYIWMDLLNILKNIEVCT